MDAFVIVTKPSTKRAATNGGKQASNPQSSTSGSSTRYTPYSTHATNRNNKSSGDVKLVKRKPLLTVDGKTPSASAIRKHLFSTLHEETNPITHSDAYARADHVTSTATGHQRSEGRGGSSAEYMERRKTKLEEQLTLAPKEGKAVLRNVRAYIDGYLEGTTDIEMKRVIVLAGGEVLYSASGATHILTSQQLSGSKTHKLLTQKKMKVRPHVVKPEWVFDSIDKGKRVSEREYSVLRNEANGTLEGMMGMGMK